MSKYVLVINCGSSSLKYQLIDMNDESVKAKGLVERIGLEGSVITHKPAGKDKFVLETPMESHVRAIQLVIEAITDAEHGVVADMKEIFAVGHRVVHGGEKFAGSVVINDEVMAAIKENVELAPLHNPANIIGIEACKEIMGDVPMVAVFDTAFHQTMPEKAYLYGIPYEDYKEFKIRRYGFHGTSHKYISARAAEIVGKDMKDLKIVTCHMGNGSSIAAVDCGKCVDTSMGFTPLAGLVMGTRAGDMDTAILPFLMGKKGMTADEAVNYLNKKSGVAGISGVSSDFRDLDTAAKDGNERAALALDMFVYGVKKYIGAYSAAMGGIDMIVFAGGIGENDINTRARILDGLEYLGVKFDASKNNFRGEEQVISADDSKVIAIVVPTDEEMMIARDTYELCK